MPKQAPLDEKYMHIYMQVQEIRAWERYDDPEETLLFENIDFCT